MERCKSCKHWDTSDYRAKAWSQEGEQWGLCEALTSTADRVERPVVRIAEAACYSEGIGGDFLARPDFGCVLHEAV